MKWLKRLVCVALGHDWLSQEYEQAVWYEGPGGGGSLVGATIGVDTCLRCEASQETVYVEGDLYAEAYR